MHFLLDTFNVDYFWGLQFNADFKIISAHTGQAVDGAKTGENPEKTPVTSASRYWLVSHVPRVGP